MPSAPWRDQIREDGWLSQTPLSLTPRNEAQHRAQHAVEVERQVLLQEAEHQVAVLLKKAVLAPIAARRGGPIPFDRPAPLAIV